MLHNNQILKLMVSSEDGFLVSKETVALRRWEK